MIFKWIPTTIKDSRFGKVKLDYSDDGGHADIYAYVEDSGRDYKVQLSAPSSGSTIGPQGLPCGTSLDWYCVVMSAVADNEDPFDTEEEIEDCGYHVREFINNMFRLCRSIPLKEM